MEISLVNIEKIPQDVLYEAFENPKEKITVTGNIDSIHFKDGSISNAFDKAEAFDNISEYLRNSDLSVLLYGDEILEELNKFKIK